jgi:hypothetical protein
MVTQSKVRIAVDRVKTPSHALGSETSPVSSALLTLLEQLRDELNAFLADVETGRELSGNRDSSQGL